MDDAARGGPEQVRHRGAETGHALLGPPLGRCDRPAVGDGGGEDPRDGCADDVGDLRPARTVEVGRPLGQGGKVGADRADVVAHRAIVPRVGR